MEKLHSLLFFFLLLLAPRAVLCKPTVVNIQTDRNPQSHHANQDSISISIVHRGYITSSFRTTQFYFILQHYSDLLVRVRQYTQAYSHEGNDQRRC